MILPSLERPSMHSLSQRSHPLRNLALGILLAAAVLPLGAAPLRPSINRFSNVNAGAILAGTSVGTVTLHSPSGSRSSTGGTSLGTSGGVSLGSCTFSGTPGHTWSVKVSSALPFILTRPGGGAMVVTGVEIQPSLTGSFPAGGTTSLHHLGVTLSVRTSATTPQGTYTGSFNLVLDDTSRRGMSSPAMAFMVSIRVDPVITLTKTTDLSFGDVFAGPAAGTVVLSPAGARTTTGGLLLGNSSPVSAASLRVHGAAYATYAILLPASATLAGPSGTLMVSSFSSTPGSSGLLSAAGIQQLNIGGTLDVAANQPDGDYSGTFAVTVTYN